MEQVLEAFKTVYQGGTGEIIMKKSRFIAHVCPVETEEAALAFIEEIRKKHWDATHNCYAYNLGTRNPLMRCSDDGEPSQTAGKPMLDVLLNQGLTNLVVVVTRYFGGTLLGTGGLVKAYQSAVVEGLNQSQIIVKEPGIQLQIVTDYNYIGKIQYLLGQETCPVLSTEYTDIVTVDTIIPPQNLNSFMSKVTDVTRGSVVMTEKEQVYFAKLDHEIHLF